MRALLCNLLLGCATSDDRGKSVPIGDPDSDAHGDTDPMDTDDASDSDTDTNHTDLPDTDLPRDTSDGDDTALVPLSFDASKRVVMSRFSGCANHPSYGVQCWGSTRPDPPFPGGWDPFTDTITTAPFGLPALDVGTGEYVGLALDAQRDLVCWPGRCDRVFRGVGHPMDIDVEIWGAVLDETGTHVGNPYNGEFDGGPWIAVAEGAGDVFALRPDGTVDHFGEAVVTRGQLDPQLRYVEIDASNDAICGIATTGDVRCAQPYPACLVRNLPPAGDWRQIVVSLGVACLLDGTGHITCWGGFDSACSPTAVDWFADVPATGRWVSVGTGQYNMCAMKPSGKVRCWGTNRFHAADGPFP